jgi:hypothetical protein
MYKIGRSILLILNNPVNPVKLTALPQRNLSCVRYVRIVVFHQPSDDCGDTLATDLPQRIKGRNPDVIELFSLNNCLERRNAVL